jgi:predicted kinase
MQARTLIIVCGLPGSGKTTHARKLERERQAIRFAPDEWMASLCIDIYDEAARARIESLQWQIAQQLLIAGLTVIIEWGTWARSERDALRTRARQLGARVELHYLSAPPELLLARVQQRAAENPPITRDALDSWHKLFEAPTLEELALFDHSETIGQ